MISYKGDAQPFLQSNEPGQKERENNEHGKDNCIKEGLKGRDRIPAFEFQCARSNLCSRDSHSLPYNGWMKGSSRN